MKETIETRELFVLDGSDCTMRGTYHKAHNDYFQAQSNRDRIGVLFLNSLSPTRAWKGDASVYWADSLAASGYPSFRLDLPGFGDSYGDPPRDLLGSLNRGSYASIISAKMRQLVTRFNLSGVIMVAHCAGTVTAVLTAAITRECRGLVLLDPYFWNLPVAPKTPTHQRIAGRIVPDSLRRSAGSIIEWVLFFANQPPRNSNFHLLSCWKELVSTGLPTLVFNSLANVRKQKDFDYMSYLERSARKGCLDVKVIEGAYHSFSNYMGRTAVRQHIERWLNDCFTLTSCADCSGVAALYKECENNVSQNKVQIARWND